MVTLVNRAKMSTSTTGTGTITLGSAESGYQSFADAGVADGDVVRYAIEDGSDWEIGSGTYTASGTTLSRTVDESSNADAALNLTGSAVVFITAAAEDVFQGELFAESYDGTSTKPNAGGTNTIAIGVNAYAVNENSIAFGTNASAQGGTSAVALGDGADARQVTAVAIGYNTYADGSASVALGRDAQARADNAIALGKSRAGAASSIAGAINNNSSSYGTTGVNSVSLGTQSRATNNSAASIGQSSIASGYQSAAYGYNAVASGQDSFAGGSTTDATATNSTALGKNAQATHANATAVGYNAATSATNQVALGASGYAVKISGTYTLPTSDGTNGQVLTTDGSGAVTFADAGGGGADLYAANPSSATDPTANGLNSVAIGDGMTTGSSAVGGIAIGQDGTVSGTNSVSLGKSGAYGTGSFAAAISSVSYQNYGADGDYSISVGYRSRASSSGAIAIGYEAKSLNNYSTAISRSYASGTDSLAAAIANNTSSYGATGANSVAIGQLAKATASDAYALGEEAQATNTGAMCFGRDSIASGFTSLALGRANTASGSSSTSIGLQNDATATGAVAIGYNAKSEQQGKLAFAAGSWGFTKSANQGQAQNGIFVLISDTTDATAEALTSNNATASTDNQIILPNNSAYSFSGTIIARESAAAGSDYASWEIKGALLRDANAASTVLGNGIKNKLYASAGASAWDIALTADTTNGGLKIEATGAAATNIRWVATVNTSEVTYA